MLIKQKITTIALIEILIIPFTYAEHALYSPRLTGQFLTGSSQQAAGFADLMFPLWSPTSTSFVFADGTVVKGNEGRYILSGGLGARSLYSDNIVGAYVFLDNTKTRLNDTYWQINPGIEWLRANYEARLQAYIPTSKKFLYANTYASATPSEVLQDLGLSRSPLGGASGHTISETPIALFEEAGTGVEIEGGRFLNVGRGVWARVGAYHFTYPTAHDINGVEGNIEISLNRHTSLLLQNNYDNQNKNLFSIGVRFDFGGVPQIEHNLESQMTSPIIRHIARQSYGEAAPVRLSYAATGPTVSQSNIWFFSPTGAQPAGAMTTYASCTAENPCSTIDTPTAQAIGTLAPNAYLYFASGNYLIPSSSNGWVNLSNGQSMSGRNKGWLIPAVGTNRPTIQGGLLWGNQSTGLIANGVISNMQIRNNGTITPNSYLTYTDNSDAQVTSNVGTVLGAAATGSLTVSNSNITVSSTQTNVPAVGITSSRSFTIDNVSVNATNTADATLAHSASTAIAVRALQDVTITNSILNARASGKSVSNATTDAFGIDANADVQVTDSYVTALQLNKNLNFGFSKALAVASLQKASVFRSTVIATASGASGVGALTDSIGINTAGDAVVNNSSIHATQSTTLSNQIASQAFGVLSYDLGTITIENQSTVTADAYGTSGINGETTALGVKGPRNIQVTDSTVSATQSSQGLNQGSGDAFAVQTLGGAGFTVTLKKSQITAKTSGNSAVSAQAIGVLNTDGSTSGTVSAEETTILAHSMGMANSGGSVNATGIFGDTLTFSGNQSTVTAISDSNTGTAKATIVGTTVNPPATNAQCSINNGTAYETCH